MKTERETESIRGIGRLAIQQRAGLKKMKTERETESIRGIGRLAIQQQQSIGCGSGG